MKRIKGNKMGYKILAAAFCAAVAMGAVGVGGASAQASSVEGSGTASAKSATNTLALNSDQAQVSLADAIDSSSSIGMAKVDDYLNVRTSPDIESDIVGFLFRGAGANVIESQGEWFHVTSGDVDGWVRGDYFVTGTQAAELYESMQPRLAHVDAYVLNVRAGAGLGNSIVGQLEYGTCCHVLGVEDGWVKIQYSTDIIAYVSEDYVTIEYGINTGITTSENEARSTFAARKAAEEAAAAAASATTTDADDADVSSQSSDSSEDTVTASDSDSDYDSYSYDDSYNSDNSDDSENSDDSGSDDVEAQDSGSDDSYDYDDSDDSGDSYDSSSYSEDSDSSSEDSYVEEASSNDGGWQYLGNFRITAYCTCATCNGSSSGITASGAQLTPGVTVAVSTSDIPLGSVIKIDGLGERVAQDTGVSSGTIDICVSSHSAAYEWGIQYRDVWIES